MLVCKLDIAPGADLTNRQRTYRIRPNNSMRYLADFLDQFLILTKGFERKLYNYYLK